MSSSSSVWTLTGQTKVNHSIVWKQTKQTKLHCCFFSASEIHMKGPVWSHFQSGNGVVWNVRLCYFVKKESIPQNILIPHVYKKILSCPPAPGPRVPEGGGTGSYPIPLSWATSSLGRRVSLPWELKAERTEALPEPGVRVLLFRCDFCL